MRDNFKNIFDKVVSDTFTKYDRIIVYKSGWSLVLTSSGSETSVEATDDKGNFVFKRSQPLEPLELGYAESGWIIISTMEKESVIREFLAQEIADEAKKASSSLITPNQKGGIDFRDRAMQIKYEALGSFSKLDFSKLSSNPALAKMNLDAEWKQISTAVGNGYVISGQRIEEFIIACNQKGQLNTRADELLCFLADYCRLLEKECCSTLFFCSVIKISARTRDFLPCASVYGSLS
ncbi:MAG: hypothetical protein HY761_04295 [Candidatus Omnitrophica bacterium]|nr:hypothetical protein [Candidatus Omnitrophota bacterium]